MPAKSKKQRQMMAIAEHHPEDLYERNKGVLKMSKEELHDFATKKHHSAQDGTFLEERRKRFGCA